MTDDKIYQELGEIRGDLRAINKHLMSVDSNLEIVRASHEANGRAIAELNERCRFHKKQLSDLYSKVGQVRETTEVMKIQGKVSKKDDDEDDDKRIALDAKYKWLTIIIMISGFFFLGGLRILKPNEFLPPVIAIALTAGVMALPHKNK